MGSRYSIAVLMLVLSALVSVAHADVVSNISLVAPARPVPLATSEQNVLSVHNPSSQSLVLVVPQMDFRLSVPAGESRRVMIDPEIARNTRILTYDVEGVSAAAPLTSNPSSLAITTRPVQVSSPLSISTRVAPEPVVTTPVVVSSGLKQPLVTNSINARNEAGQVYAALQPTISPRYVGATKRRNLASVKSICGESRLVTIEEPCPYDPPVSVFFLGEVPPPPPPKKPVRGYW